MSSEMVRPVLSCAATGKAFANGVTSSPATSVNATTNERIRTYMRKPPIPVFDGVLHRRRCPLYAQSAELEGIRLREMARTDAGICVSSGKVAHFGDIWAREPSRERRSTGGQLTARRFALEWVAGLPAAQAR